MRISVYIAISLDGYIARPDGDIGWLTAAGDSGGPEDYGYQEFFDSVDCLIMGRNTFETVIAFAEWPYGGKRVIVLSNSLKEVPKQAAGRVELHAGSLTQLVRSLEDEGFQHLYVDGGKTIQSFLRAGLVSHMTLTRVPILLGEGIPLFGQTGMDIQLRHITTTTYPSGFVQSAYAL